MRTYFLVLLLFAGLSVSAAPVPQIALVTDGAVVSVDMHLYTETEVQVEVRDAFGQLLFRSETIYPEGDRNVRVALGQIEDGVYFVRVETDLATHSEMLVVDRSH
ncbi:MAG: hypothetical protein OHK0039_18230 [Bacteroidia bacterium]